MKLTRRSAAMLIVAFFCLPQAVVRASDETSGETETSQVSAAQSVVQAKSMPVISYRTHVQKKGWTSYVTDGASSGTTGQSLRLEGIKIKSSDTSRLGVTYQTHVQSIGWMGEVSNDQLSGTTGQSKRLEAIRIRLTGTEAENYDIYYRVHSQKFGWLGWAKNGESAGTSGYGYRLESIQIKLVAKGGTAPGTTSNAYRAKPASVAYQSYVQGKGWQKISEAGAVNGSVGQGLRMEALKFTLQNASGSGKIEYRAHIQSLGWTSYVSGGTIIGTPKSGKRIEAIQIRLTGELANQYDVYYRTQIQSAGWLDWTSNNQKSGSFGMSKRVEALQAVLVKKGESPPASNGKLSFVGEVAVPSGGYTSEQATFINTAAKHALKVAPANNLYTSVMIAQAALESGYGKSTLSKAPNYNLFGIKGSYNGESVDMLTSEQNADGSWVQVTAKFRKYPSYTESFMDNAYLLRNGTTWNNAYYSGTWRENASNYQVAANALTGTYATDQSYGAKVINLIQTWKLNQFDY